MRVEAEFVCQVCEETYDFENNAGLEWPCCQPCARMIGGAAKKRAGEYGGGPIMTLRKDLKTWLRLEPWQQVDVLCDEYRDEPKTEYAYEDEDQSFTDVDLLRLSVNRVRRRLNVKGQSDATWVDVEDIADGVIVDFLQGIEDGKEIRSLHGWHWSLVNAHVAQWMTAQRERRLATVSQDVMELAEVMGIRDPYNWGATESISEHKRKEPRWLAWSKGDLSLQFENCGLTNAEVRILKGAILGDNKGMKGKSWTRRKLKTALSKIEANNPEMFDKIRTLIATTEGKE